MFTGQMYESFEIFNILVIFVEHDPQDNTFDNFSCNLLFAKYIYALKNHQVLK